jgi:spore maturation protein CgeB
VKIIVFCHSISSDWNHGNAHFLRGVGTELMRRGHAVTFYEERGAWSAANLVAEAGEAALEGFREHYPALDVRRYEPEALSLEGALDGADLVLVHEWTPPELVQRIGAHRLHGGRYRLLFHDTHHRMLTAPEEMSRFDFSGYDGVLAFGEVLRQEYLKRGWGNRVFTWHEAADVRLFHPLPRVEATGDLVWIGNFGDEERSRELSEFLLEPVRRLSLRSRVYGVRYPEAARAALAQAEIEYSGWLPNYRVPEVFASFKVTVHVPRRPYTQALPGIPTIRPFEALACGIPLVSAPWTDSEGLFRRGRDYLVARDTAEMQRLLYDVLMDPALSRTLAANGLETILARHTCGHRVDELLQICRAIGVCSVDTTGKQNKRASSIGSRDSGDMTIAGTDSPPEVAGPFNGAAGLGTKLASGLLTSVER